MAREQVINQGKTTLNGAINSFVTSIIVTDGSVFPSTDQFRVVIGSEIILVTSRSVNTLTVVRGSESTTAVSHSDNDSINQVLTKAGLQQYMRDWNSPFFDIAVAPMQLLDGSGNTLTASDFTNINFSLATKTDVAGGSILLEQQTHSAGDIASIVRTAPTPPWTITIGWIANLVNESGDFPSCGMIVRDNTTGEIYEIRLVIFDTGTAIQVNTYATPTSAAVAKSAGTTWSGGSGIVWAQIEDDNTDLIFRVSTDGLNFRELFKEPRLTFLTPDRVGFAIDAQGTGAVIDAMSTLVAWDES